MYSELIVLPYPSVHITIGFLDKEWKLLDVVNCESHWTSKTTKCKLVYYVLNLMQLCAIIMHAAETFDLSSHLMLDVLYSMEQNKIPVLTELMNNQKVRSTIAICSENTETLYKWPTFTKPSFHKPTWENLCLILNLNKRKDLVNMIKEYLKNKKGIDVECMTLFLLAEIVILLILSGQIQHNGKPSILIQIYSIINFGVLLQSCS